MHFLCSESLHNSNTNRVFTNMNADSIFLENHVTNDVIFMRLRQLETFNNATIANADISLYFSLFYNICQIAFLVE